MATTGGLPAPAPAPATFATLFSDASKDPTDGNYSTLMDPFLIDINNSANNVSTANIKDRIANAGHRRHVLATVIITAGLAHPYLLPHRWDQALTGPEPELDGKFFAFDGELIQNQGVTVEIPDAVFTIMTNQVLVPVVEHILTAINDDTTLEWLGPYTAGDANTEAVKARRIVTIPHSVAGLFLERSEGVSPRYYFETIYPQLVTEGKEAQCKSLTVFFQLAITRRAPNDDMSILEAPRPRPPSRNATLIKNQLELLQHHFDQLNPRAARAGNNLIARGIGIIAQQQQDHYAEVKEARLAEKANPVEKWLGTDRFRKLLRMLRLRNEAELVAACPVYKSMALAQEKFRMGVLQDAVDTKLTERGKRHLQVLLSPGLFKNFTSLRWHRTSEDSLSSGFLGNILLWGDTDEDAQHTINREVELVREGDSAATRADAKEILKLEINLPEENKSIKNVRRVEVVCDVLCPNGHPALNYVQEHLKQFEDFQEKWESVETNDPLRQPAKGVYHLQYLSLHLSRFWKEQALSNTTVTSLPSPGAMIEKIEVSEPWEPRLSSSLERQLRLPEFCRLLQKKVVPGDTATAGTATTTDASSIISGITGGSELSSFLRQLGAAQGGGLRIPRAPTDAGSGKRNNDDYHEAFFGQYKSRTIDGKPITSRSVRLKIERGELPKLPPSKVDGKPMCLAWHTKGICNPECPRHPDHVEGEDKYTDEEYAPLCGWCADNYPQQQA